MLKFKVHSCRSLQVAQQHLQCWPLPMQCHIVQDLIISVRNGNGGQGRDTLLNTTLKIFGENGMLAKDKELETVQDLRDALETHFGIIPD